MTNNQRIPTRIRVGFRLIPDEPVRMPAGQRGCAKMQAIGSSALDDFHVLTVKCRNCQSEETRYMNAEPVVSNVEPSQPAGIGGWLILPFLGLVLTVFIALSTLVRDTLPAFQTEIWAELTTPGGPIYHTSWAPYLWAALVTNLALVLGTLALLVLGARKRRWFPNLMIAFYVVCVAIALIDVSAVHGFLAEVLPDETKDLRLQAYRDLGRTVMTAAIWGSYFRVSERVKNTFVN